MKPNDSPLFLFADSPVLISESSTHGTIFSSLDSNEEITLKCKFDGFPVPELKFQFAGVNLNSIFNASGFVSYKFRVTRPRDFGFYSCVAENKMGTVTHYIEVYERGEFKFLKTRLIKVRLFCRQFCLDFTCWHQKNHFTACAAWKKFNWNFQTFCFKSRVF